MADKPKRGDAYTEAKTLVVRRSELSAALTRFIQANGGSVVSLPGAKDMRIETRQGSSLAAKLTELGYSVRSIGVGTRLIPGGVVETITEHSSTDEPIIRHHSGFVPVDILEIEISGPR
jgi:hypothetical protein